MIPLAAFLASIVIASTTLFMNARALGQKADADYVAELRAEVEHLRSEALDVQRVAADAKRQAQDCEERYARLLVRLGQLQMGGPASGGEDP